MSKELRDEFEKEKLQSATVIDSNNDNAFVTPYLYWLETKATKLKKKIDTLVLNVADHVNDKLELKEKLEFQLKVTANCAKVFNNTMKKLSESEAEVKRLEENVKQVIENLESKRKCFLGTEGEESMQSFKKGLSWAISSIETILPEPPKTD